MKRCITIITTITVLSVIFYSFVIKSNTTNFKQRNTYLPKADIGSGNLNTSENNIIDLSSINQSTTIIIEETIKGELVYRGSGSYVFKFVLDSTPETYNHISLSYEFLGVDDPRSICRSINDNLAIGGFIINKDTVWKKNKERISVESLKQGENFIRFSLPEDFGMAYNIRNTQLHFNMNYRTKKDRVLWVNQPHTAYYCKKYGYVNGFVSGNGSENAVVIVNGVNIKLKGNEFENLCIKPKNSSEAWEAIIIAIFPDGETLNTSVIFDKPVEPDYMIEDNPEYFNASVPVKVGEAFNISLGGASIAGEKKALNTDTKVSITSLRQVDFPMPSSGMVNVTGGASGYRFLPHGTTFSDDVKIAIAYDESLIPKGYSANDIVTYYFDEEKARWVALQRDTVDMASCMVVSETNHFTDFINAIIKTPEAPDVNAYTPTSIKELQAANPIEGLNLMQPPTVNNMGTANLNYPMIIPNGRQGMQPQINITYNNQGGNGWMGLGWDITIPSVSVETRWGVPTYSQTLETESYLMNSEQLLPLTYRHELENRQTNKHFFPRVEGAFNRIIRYGTSPQNYYWEVTDKSGVKYFYGKQLGNNALDTNSVLRDDEGNIAHWALTEMIDLHGNNVRYYYQTLFDAGVVNSNYMGKQIYCDTIKYTGHNNSDGKYMVVFNLEDKVNKYKRKDITINARYGFKQVTADLLKNIDVYYDTIILKRYYFGYATNSASQKTVLKCFGEMNLRNENGSLNNFWNTNNWSSESICDSEEDGIIQLQDFRYFSFSGFEDEITLNTYDDGVSGNTFSNTNEAVTALGGSKSSSISGGAAFTIGTGGNTLLKTFSIGGNFNWNTDKSLGLLTIIDIDGDGLPDKVFKDNNENLKYRKQLYNVNTDEFYFENQLRNITGINDFLLTKNRSHSIGGELSLGIGAAGVSGGLDNNKGTSETSVFFADVNSDGLVDIVKEGQVFFNLTNGDFSVLQSDTVYFTDTCHYIVHSGSVNDSVFIQNSSEPNFSDWGINVFHDAVRTWRVPYTGTIILNAPLQLIEDTSAARLGSTSVNGVWYFIQHNNSNEVSDSILPDDYSLKNTQLLQLAVTKDDMLYFRLNSRGDRSFDNVAWNPQIRYINQDSTLLDADNKKIYKYIASEDFLLSAPQVFTMPFNGEVRFVGNLTMPAMSDNLTFKIVKNSSDLFVKYYTNATSVNVNLDTTFAVSVNDTVSFHFIAPSNVQWSAIDFSPRLYYDTILISPSIPSTDILGNKTVEYYPIIQYSVFPNSIYASNPLFFQTATSFIPCLQISGNASGNITLSAKKNNELIFQRELTVMYGSVTQPGLVPFSIAGNQTIYFEYSTDDISLANSITSAKVCLSKNPTISYDAGLHTLFIKSLNRFGNLYRGWGQFAYNPKTIPLYNAMPQDSLVLDTAYTDTTQIVIDTNNFQGTEQYISGLFSTYEHRNPLNSVFIYMQPDTKDTCWKGYGELTVIEKQTIKHTIEAYDTLFSGNPIPYINTQTLPKAINKINKSSTDSWFANLYVSLGQWSPSSGNSNTSGNHFGYADYMDMNGDGYPDIVGVEKIQYSNPQGGLSSNVTDVTNHQGIFSSFFESTGATYGTSYMQNKQMPANNTKTAKNKAEGSGSNSHSIGNSIDQTAYTLADINGDGLPDKVYSDGHVQLNLGYKFAPLENWGFNVIQKGFSQNDGTTIGASNSFSFLNSSINGGLGTSFSESKTNRLLMDVNGDGLSDIVYDSAGYIFVQYNTGAGFLNPDYIYLEQNDSLAKSMSYNESVNAAITFGFVLGLLPVKIQFNPKASLSKSVNKEVVKFLDINNDGYPDYTVSTSENQLKVRYSRVGCSNMLNYAGNFARGQILMYYKPSMSSFENPHRNQLLDSVSIIEQITGDNRIITYQYDSAFYCRYDRQNLGYKTVKSYEHDTLPGYPVYRIKTEKYHTDNIYFKGLKFYDLITDANGNKYIENTYKYCLKDTADGSEISCLLHACTNNNGQGYPALSETNTFFYEGNVNYSKHTRKRYEHGAKGNVVTYYNDGEIGYSYSDDDFYAELAYHTDINNLNLTGIPQQIIIKNANNDLLQKREAEIDAYTGKVTQMKLYYSNYYISYDMLYDNFGNLEKFTYPPNDNNERYEIEYSYDNDINTYPIHIEDVLGYASTAQYDLKWGKPVQTTDKCGNNMIFNYDKRGRLSEIIAPYELDEQLPYTLKYEYWIDDRLNFEQNNNNYWARTSHYNTDFPTDDIVTVLFVDGLGRTLQTKKDATVDGNELMTVSGAIIYDAFGREVLKYYPITETLGHDTIYNDTLDSITPTRIYYDVLNRQTKVILPNNDSTYFYYGFGADKFSNTQFATEQIDFNGNSTTTYTNVLNLPTTIRTPNNSRTAFEYDQLGRLFASYDPEENATLYEYDLLGRLVLRTHPDAGSTYFVYDDAGNIIQKQTQLLYENSDTIEYTYNYNQLTSVIYPLNPEQNVKYDYGDAQAGNNAGRLVLQEDATGLQSFSYGKMGEMIENIRTFVIPNAGQMTFAMQFEYDSWNRTRNITYADGEVVTYAYDRSGNLLQMNGDKNTDSFDYIENIFYDKFGSRTLIEYSNDIRTQYTYEPVRRRLSEIHGVDINTSETVQSVLFYYDKMDNIIRVDKMADRSVNDVDYTMRMDYEYDDLSRLTNASGAINTTAGSATIYDYILSYSPSGNIINKTVKADILTLQGQLGIEYDNTYDYNMGLPHTINTINSDEIYFDWDVNGNMKRMQNRPAGIDRKMCWDEENRLKVVYDQELNLSAYLYDASGERTLKFQGPYQSMLINGQYWYNFLDVSNYTLYTSPYMVLTNTKNEYTKHYYIEADRVVSKIGGGLLYSIHDIETHVYGFDIGNDQDYDNKNSDIQYMLGRDFECVGIGSGDFELNPEIEYWLTDAQVNNEPEGGLYFYHKDHLGSSTQISDANAAIIHHIEYMPYGENFLEMSNKWQTLYKFNGKEKDEETGMYYYGARYYTPELSIWLSVDPLSDNTPWASAYAYCINNPVRLIDPDGKDWYENEEGKAVYSEKLRSQKDMNDAGVKGKYIGITGYSKDKSQYLSLFGSKVNTKNADGELNSIAKMVENLDNAIINSYKANYFNNPSNRDPYDSEIYQGETDMFVKNISANDVSSKRDVKQFNYAGGKVTYQMSNNATGGLFSWGDGKIRNVGGYFVSIGIGANATVERNNARFRVVNWIFPTTNAWQNTKNRADGLLKNRKW